MTSSLVASRMAVQFQVSHLPLSATPGPPDTLHLSGASARILIQRPAPPEERHCRHVATDVSLKVAVEIHSSQSALENPDWKSLSASLAIIHSGFVFNDPWNC